MFNLTERKGWKIVNISLVLDLSLIVIPKLEKVSEHRTRQYRKQR